MAPRVKTKSPKAQRELKGRKDDPVYSESELTLANTKRFLEQLAGSDTDSRRYVVRLKESLEHELRRGKLRTERGEESH